MISTALSLVSAKIDRASIAYMAADKSVYIWPFMPAVVAYCRAAHDYGVVFVVVKKRHIADRFDSYHVVLMRAQPPASVLRTGMCRTDGHEG